MTITSKQMLLLAAFLVLGTTTSAAAATCESLSDLRLPHATVTSAQSITTGTLPADGSAISLKGLPPFCRVAVTSKPTSDSLINIEIWIPLGEKWNGKYEQVGCGGFCGALQIQRLSLARAIGRGYAGAATDDGSQSGGDGSFALGHPEKVIDFGYRALKETTDDAKAIIAAFAGKQPQRSYFNGCSDGGREALMEAQRYPEDFDGIIVGAPANNWTHVIGGAIANQQALLRNPDSYIPATKLSILSKAALAQCRAGDGSAPEDKFLNNPLACRFDPETVQCKEGQDPGTCLTPAQVKAAKAIYEGPRDPRTGTSIAAGFEPGFEDDPGSWPTWITGTSREANLSGNDKPPTLPLEPTRGALQGFFAYSFYANFVSKTPKVDILTLDVSASVAAADKAVGKAINSTDPDLRPFKRHGGKIIQYHGWGDSALAPRNSVNYYNAVRATLTGKPTTDPESGSFKEIQDFYRLFMVPGMGHCGGGPGAIEFGGYVDPPVVDADHDILKALERWVEQGTAPDKIIATRYVNGNPRAGVQFQRPLCPFPQVARYNGQGDPANADSFTCR